MNARILESKIDTAAGEIADLLPSVNYTLSENLFLFISLSRYIFAMLLRVRKIAFLILKREILAKKKKLKKIAFRD